MDWFTEKTAIWVLVHSEDRRFTRKLGWAFLFGPPLLTRYLEYWSRVPRNGILIWTKRTNDFALQDAAFLVAAVEREWLVLPTDETPIHEALLGLRRLEWTNAVDIYWQWRVANGAPPDHVNRPKH